MHELRRALGRAAETIADYREGLAEARVGLDSEPRRRPVDRSASCPTGRRRSKPSLAELVDERHAGTHRDRRAPVLRLRDRRHPRRGAGRRDPRRRLGSVRLQRRALACRDRLRGRRRRLAQGPPRPYRRPRPWASPPAPRARTRSALAAARWQFSHEARLGRGSRRAPGRAACAGSSSGPSATPRSIAASACSGSARAPSSRFRLATTAPMDTGALPAALEDGVPTIVCAQVGQRQHGRMRRHDGGSPRRTHRRCLGSCRRRFRALGGSEPRTASLVRGVELADSWACDGHKWLNVPYDCGYAICAHPDVHATALAYTASYLTGQVAGREPRRRRSRRRVVAARARLCNLGGSALARPLRRRRARRPLQRPRPPLRRERWARSTGSRS